MGPNRVDLWKIALGRNCEYLNKHNHVIQLCTLSNTDLQPFLTKHGVVQYVIKYIRKLKHIFGNGVAQIENAMSNMANSENGGELLGGEFGAVTSRLSTSSVAHEKLLLR